VRKPSLLTVTGLAKGRYEIRKVSVSSSLVCKSLARTQGGERQAGNGAGGRGGTWGPEKKFRPSSPEANC